MNSAPGLGVAEGFGAAEGLGRFGGRIITTSGVGLGGTTTIGRGAGVAGLGTGVVDGAGAGCTGRTIGRSTTSSKIVTVSVVVVDPTGPPIGRPGVGAGTAGVASTTTRPG